MNQTTRQIGFKGEEEACNLLVSKGYAIVQTNAYVGNVEVDIIAQCHNRVIFVEVKTRKEGHLDDDFALDRRKLQRIARAADLYIRSRNLPHEAQIDAVLVTNAPDGSVVGVTHLEDITIPPMRRRR